MPWKVSSKDTFQSHSYSLYFTLFSYVWLLCTIESCWRAFRAGRQLHLCDLLHPGGSTWEGRGNTGEATRPGGASAQTTSGVAQQQWDRAAPRPGWLASLNSTPTCSPCARRYLASLTMKHVSKWRKPNCKKWWILLLELILPSHFSTVNGFRKPTKKV